MGVGTQTQGREGLSLGKGSQDPTTYFFSRTTAIQTLSQTRPQQFIASLSHRLPPKSLTWDPSLSPLRKLRVPSTPVPELLAATDPFPAPPLSRKLRSLAPTTLCLTQPHSGK